MDEYVVMETLQLKKFGYLELSNNIVLIIIKGKLIVHSSSTDTKRSVKRAQFCDKTKRNIVSCVKYISRLPYTYNL